LDSNNMLSILSRSPDVNTYERELRQ